MLRSSDIIISEINKGNDIYRFIDLEAQKFKDDASFDTLSVPYRNTHEEPWTKETEKMLSRWRLQIDKLVNMQEASGYYIKKWYRRLSIPAIIIPFMMTFITQVIPTNDEISKQVVIIIGGVFFMITSSLTGLLAFYNYGQLYEKHFSYAARYDDLSGRIESVLTSGRKYRIPVDVFTTEIKCKLDSLNENSPKIPPAILNTKFE